MKKQNPTQETVLIPILDSSDATNNELILAIRNNGWRTYSW